MISPEFNVLLDLWHLNEELINLNNYCDNDYKTE